MYLTLVVFHVFQHLWLLTSRISGFFVQRYLIDPGKKCDRLDRMQALVAIVLVCQNVATNLLVAWCLDSEEIGFAVCFGANCMETRIDVAGAFIEIALCWSVVDRAKGAGLSELIDLISFRLGSNFRIILE